MMFLMIVIAIVIFGLSVFQGWVESKTPKREVKSTWMNIFH